MARRTNRRKSQQQREQAAWFRVFAVVLLTGVAIGVWLNVLKPARQAKPSSQPSVVQNYQPPSPKTPSVQQTQPAKPEVVNPQPKPEAAKPVPLPKPSVTYQEAPLPEPQTTQPAVIPQPEPPQKVEPVVPKPQPKPLSYTPVPSARIGVLSPMANPTPNARVQIPGQSESGLIMRRLSKPGEKLVALTFDDGPHPSNTPQVLEILARYGIQATFFWIGRELRKYPDVARSVVVAGHAVGNHTWNHRSRLASEAVARAEIDDTQALIESTVGTSSHLFRPPGGHLKNGLADYALRNGFTVVVWSVQSNDWDATSSEEIMQNVLGAVSPGTIVLMHDGGGDRSKTIAALPQIIETLQAEGYRFVTVQEMLEQEKVSQ